MFGCKPDPELTAMLREAAKNPPTEEQLRQQRKSWVRGELAMGSDRDEAEYRAALKAGDADKLAALDEASEQRAALVDAVFDKIDKS